MTDLVLVRHGQTQWNRERRIQGHTDSPLTAEGRAQAVAMCGRLATEAASGAPFHAAYTSDLGRAHDTARLILPTGPWVTTPQLRERSYGAGEGLTYTELEARFPGAFSRENELDPDYRIEGGESRRDLAERVDAELARIAEAHAGERVLVVTHGGVLAAVWRHVHGHPPSSPHAADNPNVGYNHIRYSAGAWHIVAWGDVAHFAEVAPITVADAV